IALRYQEFFREVGLTEAVQAVTVQAQLPGLGQARTLAEFDAAAVSQPAPAFSTPVSPTVPTGHCPQDRLDSALLPAALERGATVEFGVAVRSVAQDADGVSATLSDGRVVRA